MYSITLIIAISVALKFTNGLKCVSNGPCGCTLDDGSKKIDPSPMIKAAGKTPMFPGIVGTEPSYKYDVDLCTQFLCGKAAPTKTNVCLKVQSIVNMAIGKDVAYEYDAESDIVTFVYSGFVQSENVQTRITMHCSTTAPGIGTMANVNNDKDSKLFTTALTSKYACFSDGGGGNSSKGLSIGSILCITILVLLIVYLVAGILINKYVRKVEAGESVVPNHSFWSALPGYVKDGCSFTVSKIKGNKEYEQI